MSRYGENSDLVEEVIDFIKHGELFNNNNQSLSDIIFIEDFERAQQLAWSQDADEVDVVWQDIKSNESGHLLGKILSDVNLKTMDDELSNIFNSDDNYSEDFIPMDFWDIAEEVESDLYKCAINRLVNGKKDNLFEKMFQVYKSGGWPCGWDGTYPKGKLVAFIPQ
ncbi:cytoplasmic protein [Bacillus atrophaeus]|uniref:cytoplasmic protein n=1 Tax=Bacillus atrophaeus TaxID=1452 RepID=UPI00227F5F40|nr:cytoplasmic protein [Bacillus atrophaeus]MCY8913690.1 cytoplasmic protein [Bacillus atrophaeus]MCY9113352.1 cytoplasmic protein [Bacillus atrophaeus]MEC0925584.1 cytoplasmic protein [Bacillus atrophaeus]MEC0934265.1 cytoplasmic protein [Bacillus atrophaeus]